MYRDAKKLLSDTKFYESYSRFRDEDGRYETWDEAVDRVMDMHKGYYKDKINPELSALIDKVTTAYKEKRVLGSQRALQFGGEQMLAHQLKLYNCTGSYADRPEFFGEFFYALLCLSPDTKIRTSEGLKEIQHIEIGDEVLTYNETEKIYEYRAVYNTIETPSENKEKLEIELENGAKIKCTVDHKFLTKNRGWVEAQYLSDSDDLINFTEMN